VTRAAALGLACLSLFLLAFPLTLAKPGVPVTLKADEGAYYLMALSLARDADLRLELADVERVFREFPYRPVQNVILMTDDGWRSIQYGKPYVYSLFAAPFAGLWGANGMLFLNLALTVAMLWMGADYLARFNAAGPAAIFAAGFVLVSAGFAYSFWLQPEVFNMAAVSVCLYLAFRDRGAGSRTMLWAALSGAALALAIYNKPMVAAVGLPALVVFYRRRPATALAWLLGAALSLGAVAGLGVLLTGHPTPYLGVVRQGVTICDPDRLPIQPAAPAPAAPGSTPAAPGPPGEMSEPAPIDPTRPTGGAWSWIFGAPEVDWPVLFENLRYFLWGRHTGVLLYFPFAALAVLLFLRERGDGARWLLLAGLAATALFTLIFISHNWQGGGGFLGNRYFVSVYPAFLYLVRGVGSLPALAGYGLGGLFLAPILLTPFGPVGPEPTYQAHVRNAPFRLFPLELSLREVPGYHRLRLGDFQVLAARDAALPQGEELWVRGAGRTEIWLIGEQPVQALAFDVRSVAPGNVVTLKVPGDHQELRFPSDPGGGEPQRVTLRPSRPTRVRSQRGARLHVYKLMVETESGRARDWIRHSPPDACPYFAYQAQSAETFYLGAALTYLGTGEAPPEDLYAVRWDAVEAPAAVAAGSTFTVPVRVTNRSPREWRPAGAARVWLAYHWVSETGAVVVFEGERSELPQPVAPGAQVAARAKVVAPATPGRYRLQLDLVFERFAWFSQRDPANLHQVEIEVLPASP
jgi:hypothetical protein